MMATQDELSKLETVFQGQIYYQIATYEGFDASRLEAVHRGELFYAVTPGQSEIPTPTYRTGQMFAIF